MILLEQYDKLDSPPSIQIFASDLSARALHRAREAIYPDTIAADVSPARLQRFFVREPGGYRIRRDVREMVLFTQHNLLKDPPFSKIDLIVCRNMLIYLSREVQREIFNLFHYALRPLGFLFLGSSEILDDARIFQIVDRQHSVYQRLPIKNDEHRLPALPITLSVYQPLTALHETQLGQKSSMGSFETFYGQTLEHYAPPSLVVDANYEILRFSPNISPFLFQPPGAPTNSVLQRLREEFRLETATLLFRAFVRQEPGLSPTIETTVNGSTRWVTIGVWPTTGTDHQTVALVLFHERTENNSTETQDANTPDSIVVMLKEEIFSMRQRLQVAAEEFETSQEEMHASNEELQSINEELRSTAEELETSKEELQSINEELITVNQENKNKVDELSRLTGDLQNLLVSTDIATLFLDSRLCITLFTPRASEIFNVLITDRGRPLAHITHNLLDDAIIQDAAHVLQTLTPIAREVSSRTGHSYLMRLLPYHTIEDRIDGVVFTFIDITERVRNEQKLQQLTASLDARVTERTQQVRMLASQVLGSDVRLSPTVREGRCA
jgi:two-component system CheB/CheR fusion protein